MTLSEVIAEVNVRNPNDFEEETKAKILCSLETRILHKFTDSEKTFEYPTDMNTELCLPERYAEVYIFYLSAMVFFWNKEYEEFNNHVTQYNSLFEEYEKEFGSKRETERKRFYNLY